jgi:hypothetical protein
MPSKATKPRRKNKGTSHACIMLARMNFLCEFIVNFNTRNNSRLPKIKPAPIAGNKFLLLQKRAEQIYRQQQERRRVVFARHHASDMEFNR